MVEMRCRRSSASRPSSLSTLEARVADEDTGAGRARSTERGYRARRPQRKPLSEQKTIDSQRPRHTLPSGDASEMNWSIRSPLFRGDASDGVTDPTRTYRVPGPRAFELLAAAALAIALAPAASRAAWHAGGNLLGPMVYGGRLHSPYHVVTPERPGSCLVWLGYAPSPLWRVHANGDADAIWPDPVIYPGTPGGTPGAEDYVSDGAGGFIAVWLDHRAGP